MKRNDKVLCALLASAMVITSCPMPTYATEAAVEMKQEPLAVEEALAATETTATLEESLANSKATVDDFEYTEGEEGITITGYSGTDTSLDLSEIFPGKDVVAIGEAVFKNKDNLLKVIIPETVKVIGDSAFNSCDSLAQVEFAGENPVLESIGERAFYDLDKLTTIKIPETVKTIGAYAFWGCNSLVQLEFTGENPVLEGIGNYAFYDNDRLIKIVLPETVKTIGDSAFCLCSSLVQIEFAGENPALESIGASAFRDNDSLTKITLPETVRTIGNHAFRDSKALVQVEFAGESPALESIGTYAFDECEALAKFTFPDKVVNINERAFYNTALKDIVLPETLILIGNQAFYSCNALRTVEVKSQDVSIMEDAFANCGTNWVMIGEQGSTAQQHAEEMGYVFNRYTDSISINSLPDKTEYFYGEELNTEGLTIIVDYTSDTEPATEEVTAEKCIFSGYDKNKIGTQTVTVSYAGKTTTFDVTVYYNLENATVANIKSYDYTGEAIIPELTITGKETQVKLVEGTDYKVELEENVNAGTDTAIVYIIGIGKYKGEVSKNFTINKRYITSDGITATFPSVSYNGFEHTPIPVIMDGDVILTEEDYTIESYENNVNAGKGKAYIQANGNYRNRYSSDYFEFTIEPRDIALTNIKNIPEQFYTGNQIQPEIEVQEDEYTVLEKGKDYTVQYTNNTEIGTAKVLITGKGNYKGTIEKTFTIKSKSLEDVTIYEIDEQYFTGKEIKPSLTLYDEKHYVELKEGTDYTVTYEDNVNAGTATVKIEGIGNYEGMAETTFTIKPATFYLYNNVEVSRIENCVYSGEEQTPSFEVEFNESIILEKDVDYRVTYEQNVNAGTAGIVIEGIGNYRGYIECEFYIDRQKLTNVTVNDLPGYTYTGKKIEPAIDLKMDGKSLVLNQDYEVDYAYNVEVGTATVYMEGIGNYVGTVERTFEIEKKNLSTVGIRNIADQIYTGQPICPAPSLELDADTALTLGVDYMVSYESNTDVGTATVRVRGIGNYSGVAEKTFRIMPKSLDTVSLSVTSVVDYIGVEVTPYLNVISGGKILVLNRDYTATYSNNKNIGTASVTVTGIGNYTGTLSTTFTIQAKKGSKYTAGAYVYKVTGAEEVAFAGLKNSSTKKVNIPKEVNIGGKKFKVTSIANNALKGKAVTNVTIGKNVKKIGKSAFEKCSKLKKITIITTALKKVDKKAFKGIHAKAVIKVPKKKLKAYKQLMKNKGQSATVQIK